MKKIYITIILAVFTLFSFSQDEYINKPDGFISMGWAPSWGTGNLGDFVSDGSYRGFFFEGKKFVTDNFAVGGTFGWSGFYEIKDRETLDFDDVSSVKASGAITGNLSNYYYNFPILVSFSYYPTPEYFIKPYISLYTGTVYNRLESYLGTYGLYDETWQFQVAPEIGAFIPFGKDAEFGFHIAGRYNYITYQKYRFNGIQYFQLNVGVSWLL
jgi:hypothetical protein